MNKEKKQLDNPKMTLKYRIVMCLLVAFILVVTASAWVVDNGAGNITAGSATIKAALIDATYTITEGAEKGIPGETQDLLVTLTINNNTSDRDFIYEISLPDGVTYLKNLDEDLPLGRVLGFKALTDDEGDFIDNIIDYNGNIYGRMLPGDESLDIQFYMNVKFLGRTVVTTRFDYDGNDTFGHGFTVDGIKITGVQATKQAVINVFGFDENDDIDLLTELGVG